MSSVSARKIADSLEKLHKCHNLDENEFFSSEEILENIVENVPDDPNDELYRGFVASTNKIHKSPRTFLPRNYADLIRRKKGDGYKGWAFKLVTEDEIGSKYRESGFEGNASHKENNRNLDLWNKGSRMREEDTELRKIIQDYEEFYNSDRHVDEEYKRNHVNKFQEEWPKISDKHGKEFFEAIKSASDIGNNLIGWRSLARIGDVFDEDPDEATEAFKNLLDGKSPIEERVDRFFEVFYRQHDESSNRRGTSFFLASLYPEKFIFYKYTEFKKFFEDFDLELEHGFNSDNRVEHYLEVNQKSMDLLDKLNIGNKDLWNVQDLIYFYKNYWMPNDLEQSLENVFSSGRKAYTRLYALKCFFEIQEDGSVSKKELEDYIGEGAKDEDVPGENPHVYKQVGTNVFDNYEPFVQKEDSYRVKEEYQDYLKPMKLYVDYLWSNVNPDPSYYFVTQHDSGEIDNEYLKAPTPENTGRKDPRHDLAKLNKGDIVFNYVDNEIIGCSTVIDEAEEREIDGEMYYRVDVDFEEFDEAILLGEVSDKLVEEADKKDEYYVLDENGNKKQGYLWELTDDGGQYLMNMDAKENSETCYFWVNAKPSRWKVSSIEDGGTAFYTAYNQKGNKRRNSSAFESASAGDKVIFYESQPEQKVVATGEIVEGLHEEEHENYDDAVEGVSMKYGEELEEIAWEELKSNKDLSDVLPLDNFQGSLFEISKEAYEKVLEHGSLTEKNKERLKKYVRSTDFDLDIPDSLFFQTEANLKAEIEASLNSGKNIIFTGPPGTGKTKLAKDISKQVSGEKEDEDGHKEVEATLFTTATADWTAFDTIGGYMPSNGSSELEFNAGQFLKCFRKENGSKTEVTNKWLVIDEINRSDIDKAFGQLFSVLSGDSVELPYTKNDEHVEIRRVEDDDNLNEVAENDHIYPVTDSWRLIATMNTMDKTSLYEMSYAFMRRFNFIHVGVPSLKDGDYINIEFLKPGNGYADVWNEKHSEAVEVLEKDEFYEDMSVLWYKINQTRSIGPSIILDMLKYLDARNYEKLKDEERETALADAITSLVFPQLEGLTKDDLEMFIGELYKKEQLNGEENVKLDLVDKKQLTKTAESFFNRDLNVKN